MVTVYLTWLDNIPPSFMPSKQLSVPLLAYITAFFYILFSLYPDSHSLMVAWSWVFVWQVGLFCPLLWFMVELWDNRCLYLLGNGFDYGVLIVCLSIGLSTLGAECPEQARWYAWSSGGFLVTLYPVSRWLNNPLGRYRIFLGQGYLSLAFVTTSLALWFSQTFLPEVQRLEALGVEDASSKFNLSLLTLRNWAPLGHQNYVAGYLILCLPMLLGLAVLHRDWRRWLWLTGVAVGGVDLYTTSSRGGWLGLAVAIATAFLLAWNFSQIRKFWLTLAGTLSTGILFIALLTNDRLFRLVIPILQGQGLGELDYRWVNAQVGWQMGISHPWTGVGLGNVPLLYQQYRPFEAGRLSELIYQLHSTPVQLGAEMGLLGLGLFFGSLGFLGWILWRIRDRIVSLSRQDRILLSSIYTGLIGYWALSLTDYQLDNVCISGIIVILLGILAAIARNSDPDNPDQQPSLPATPYTAKFLGKARYGALGLLGLYAAIALWLLPIHIAWEKSSQGFAALDQETPDYDRFTQKLTEAHNLAPWEPYYPYQLAWNLGEAGLQASNPEARTEYLEQAINWFNESNDLSSVREFSHTNLAWLYMATQQPAAATEEFMIATQLVPAKRGLFYGLGVSLLEQGKLEPAIQAIALEILRDPQFMTNPIWRSGGLVQLYPAVVNAVMQNYNLLLEQYPNDSNLHRSRGAIAWWIGDQALAERDLSRYGSEDALFLPDANTDAIESHVKYELPITLLHKAWAEPEKRLDYLQKAWQEVGKLQPMNPIIEQDFLVSMSQARSFNEWLRAYAPEWQYRRQRSGFNVISRHIDGPNPSDFWLVTENVAIVTWFNSIFPSITYRPSFEQQLQPLREQLWQTLANQ